MSLFLVICLCNMRQLHTVWLLYSIIHQTWDIGAHMHSQCTEGRCSRISIQYHTQFCMRLRTAWAILHCLKGKKYCNILLELLFLFVVFNSITTMQISLFYFESVLKIIYYPTYTLPLLSNTVFLVDKQWNITFIQILCIAWSILH